MRIWRNLARRAVAVWARTDRSAPDGSGESDADRLCKIRSVSARPLRMARSALSITPSDEHGYYYQAAPRVW